jgi:hypothetical protein
MSIEDNSPRRISYWTNNTGRNEQWPDLSPATRNNSEWLAGLLVYSQWNGTDVVYNNESDYDWTPYYFHYLTSLQNYNANLTANLGSVTWTSTDQPVGTVTWPMWMFWTVACTLVLGSIVLPVIGGRVLRFLVRRVVRSSGAHPGRVSIRALASLLWLL